MVGLSGPLGLWKFPLLGMLFNMLNKSEGSHTPVNTVQEPAQPKQRVFTQNEERWEMMRNRKGELTGIVVHRKLE